MRADTAGTLDFVRGLGATHVALTAIRAREEVRLAERFSTRCEALQFMHRISPTALVLRIRGPDEATDQSGCDALASYLASVDVPIVRPPEI
jgi:hypothetical protein